MGEPLDVAQPNRKKISLWRENESDNVRKFLIVNEVNGIVPNPLSRMNAERQVWSSKIVTCFVGRASGEYGSPTSGVPSSMLSSNSCRRRPQECMATLESLI